MIYVHISDIRAFKSCRRKWYWSSPIGDNLEPDMPYAPFFVGRIIHTTLEDYYMEGVALEDALARAIEVETDRARVLGSPSEAIDALLEENMEMMFGMIQAYQVWINGKPHNLMPFGDANLEFLDVELGFQVPLYNREGKASNKVGLGGRFDGLVRRKDDNSLWLWEAKTTRSIPELQRSLEFDEQASAYIYAAQILTGKRIHGVIYNIMRKKAPTVPRQLVAGGVSKNRRIDTTFDTYLGAVKEAHPDYTKEDIIAEYGDILEELQNQPNPFFSRTAVRRTTQEIEEFAEQMWHVALEMVRPSTLLYPTAAWNTCGFCHFRNPCALRNAGGDWEGALRMEYRQRTDRVLRPAYSGGFRIIPLGIDPDTQVDYWTVFYRDETIARMVPSFEEAISQTVWWIEEANESEYTGPDVSDFIRGLKDVGVVDSTP